MSEEKGGDVLTKFSQSFAILNAVGTEDKAIRLEQKSKQKQHNISLESSQMTVWILP
jgi:hypothetical protein